MEAVLLGPITDVHGGPKVHLVLVLSFGAELVPRLGQLVPAVDLAHRKDLVHIADFKQAKVFGLVANDAAVELAAEKDEPQVIKIELLVESGEPNLDEPASRLRQPLHGSLDAFLADMRNRGDHAVVLHAFGIDELGLS